MKVILAGSRSLDDAWLVFDAMQGCPFVITEVVSGHAKGVDILGEQWALDNDIDLVVFHANWRGKGRAAGILRNQKMAAYADALVAIWDGMSKGTYNMIKTMEALGKPVYVYKTDDHGN